MGEGLPHGGAHHIGGAEPAAQHPGGRQAAPGHHQVHRRLAGPAEVLQAVAHGPAGGHGDALRLQTAAQGAHHGAHGEVQRRHAQEVHGQLLSPLPGLLHQALCQGGKGLGGAGEVGVHPVGGKAEGRDARALLDEGGQGGKIGADDHGDGGPGQGDEGGMELPGGLCHVPDELLVVPHHRLQLRKAREKHQTVGVVPPGLVVGVVGGVAAGGVVHDGHAPQLEEGGAHAGHVGGVGGNDPGCLSHTQHPHPRPFT